MNSHPKLINRAYFSKLISPLTQILQIPCQRRTVATYIHNPFRVHLDHGLQQSFITAFSWRVYDDDICINSIFLILSWQHFFCFAHKELCILQAH